MEPFSFALRLTASTKLSRPGMASRYAFVHDEQALGCPPDVADQVASICTTSAAMAGNYYKLRIRIDADAQIGDNWAQVH